MYGSMAMLPCPPSPRKDPFPLNNPRLFLSAIALVAALSLSAAPDPTYTALRASRPDGRTVAVTNFAFDRDVYHLTLNGTLHLLAPVDGKEVGAVFTGDGIATLTPATPPERRQLAINSGDDKLTVLTEKFERAVFFDAALVKQVAATATRGAPAPDATKAFDDFSSVERRKLHDNVHIRVLQELLDPVTQPLFLAFIRGRNYGPAFLGVDPRGYDVAFSTSLLDGGEKTYLSNLDDTKGGLWYLAYMKSELDGGTATVLPRPALADRYLIDTTIAPNSEISGSTTIALTVRNATRVLPFALDGKLRIDDVSIAKAGDAPQFTPAAFIQEKPEEDDNSAAVFATALQPKEPYLVKVTYHGIDKHVLESAGDGNYTVRARDSWYANVGRFSEPAMFELTFHYPQKNQLISIGSETENKVVGDQRVAVWKSPRPMRVAGFNYGRFKKLSNDDKESGMSVDVYTNTGEPDIIRQINQALSSGGDVDENGFPSLNATQVHIDTASLAQSAFADAANMSRVGNLYFGPLADKRIAMTQQSAWFSGQSWPGLVYLPYVAFISSTTRHMMGMGLETKDFVDAVGPHEMSHQWWGHQVGWATYHDQWLSEGFAELSAMLVLQNTGGAKAMNSLWEKKRRSIIEKPMGGRIPSADAGPITQGIRLATWQNGEAYQAIVYNKGAYILHMLRMAMFDAKTPMHDETFAAMMKDFATTYAGKNATTDDFQHIVEKYAPPQLKLTRDGKLDYFFRQWVWGSAIPKYTSDLKIEDAGNGKYRLSGTITQSEVPDDFAVTMPMYVQFDKGIAKLGSVVLVGNQTKPVSAELALPVKPQKMLINANHDILAR
jgi:hypothetical protein